MSQRYKKPVIDESRLVNNPFALGLVIPVVKRTEKTKYTKLEEGMFNVDYYMERESPVRVYVSSVRRKLMNGLSANGHKLLHWCMQVIDVNKDWFWLNKGRYMEETGISYNTYKKCVEELQDSGLLSKTSINDVFWFNPEFFFRGSRKDFYSRTKGVINIVSDLSDGGN